MIKIEKMVKKTLKSLHDERDRLSSRLAQINHISDALSTLNGSGPGPRKGRKLSAAHKAKIRAGIKRARLQKNGTK
jgi:hypothetical protein